MSWRIGALCVLSAVLLAGCGKKADKPSVWAPTMRNPPVRAVSQSDAKFVEDMADDDVIVSVNGIALTKRDADTRLKRTRWTLFVDKRLTAEKKNRLFMAYGATMIPQFVNTQLMVCKAREAGLLDEAAVVKGVSTKVRQCARIYGRKPEKLDAEIPGGLYELRRTFEDMVWCEAFAKTVKPDTVVDDAYVSNLVADVEAENKSISETNSAVRARLEGILRDVNSGAITFDDAAKMYTDASLAPMMEGASWGVFQPSFIEPESLRSSVSSLKKGEISGILEDDDCYMVVKMIDRADKPAEGSMLENRDEPVFTLGRIALEKSALVELAYGTDMKEELQKQFFREALDRRVEQLAAEAQIVYPHGTNFWKKTEGRPRRPSKKKKSGGVKKEGVDEK